MLVRELIALLAASDPEATVISTGADCTETALVTKSVLVFANRGYVLVSGLWSEGGMRKLFKDVDK